MTPLSQLHLNIDNRVQHIRQNQADWLCTKSCDTCCRQLADLPQLTAAEWDLLRQGLAALPSEHQHSIRNKVATLPDQPTSPITCPLLDTITGACPVYPHRPVASRRYGFYVQREQEHNTTRKLRHVPAEAGANPGSSTYTEDCDGHARRRIGWTHPQSFSRRAP